MTFPSLCGTLWGMDIEREFGYLTVRQVAQRAGVSERRVRQVIEEGRLVSMKIGGTWFVLPGSAEAWLHSDRRPGRPLKGKGKVKGRQLVMDVDNSE